MPNLFRDRTLKGTYDVMLNCFRTRHKDLIYPSGRRCKGSGGATAFWRGYDGRTNPIWDTASKTTPAYACYRAGQDVKRFVDAGIYEDVPDTDK